MIQSNRTLNTRQRPVVKFGRSTIQTAVWKNDKGYSVTLSKSYKDVKGQSEIQQVLAEMNSIMVLDLNGGHFSKQTIVKLNTNNQGGSLTVKPYLADLTQILPKISAYEAEQLLQKFAKLEELLKKLH
jgi:hypothetical protein